MEKIEEPLNALLIGEVDSGKTSLIGLLSSKDYRKEESRGITQGFNFLSIPGVNISKQIRKFYKKEINFSRPLVLVDTPGHSSFKMVRDKGLKICDLVIILSEYSKAAKINEDYLGIPLPKLILLTKIDKMEGFPRKPPLDVGAFLEKNPVLRAELELAGNEVLNKAKGVGEAHRAAIIPISNLTGVGIPNLLVALSGMEPREKEPLVLSFQKGKTFYEATDFKGALDSDPSLRVLKEVERYGEVRRAIVKRVGRIKEVAYPVSEGLVVVTKNDELLDAFLTESAKEGIPVKASSTRGVLSNKIRLMSEENSKKYRGVICGYFCEVSGGLNSDNIHTLFEMIKGGIAHRERDEAKRMNAILNLMTKLEPLEGMIFRGGSPLILGIRVAHGKIRKNDQVGFEGEVGEIEKILVKGKESEFVEKGGEASIQISKLKFSERMGLKGIFKTLDSRGRKKVQGETGLEIKRVYSEYLYCMNKFTNVE